MMRICDHWTIVCSALKAIQGVQHFTKNQDHRHQTKIVPDYL